MSTHLPGTWSRAPRWTTGEDGKWLIDELGNRFQLLVFADDPEKLDRRWVADFDELARMPRPVQTLVVARLPDRTNTLLLAGANSTLPAFPRRSRERPAMPEECAKMALNLEPNFYEPGKRCFRDFSPRDDFYDTCAGERLARVRAWLAKLPRYHLHLIPTYSSWLNQVERWFGQPASSTLHVDRQCRFDPRKASKQLMNMLRLVTTISLVNLISDSIPVRVSTTRITYAGNREHRGSYGQFS
jgi:hypothetical protein